jgi:hypothetical protein
VEKALAVAPVVKAPMRSFWSTGAGWGSFRVDAAAMVVAVDEGALPLQSIRAPRAAKDARVRAGKREIAHTVADGVIRLNEEVRLGPGDEIRLTWGMA